MYYHRGYVTDRHQDRQPASTKAAQLTDGCQLELRLEDNQLEGPIPAEWANLGNLEELSFGGNRGMDELRDDWIAGRLPHCLVTF